jgi:hypothetical protein
VEWPDDGLTCPWPVPPSNIWRLAMHCQPWPAGVFGPLFRHERCMHNQVIQVPLPLLWTHLSLACSAVPSAVMEPVSTTRCNDRPTHHHRGHVRGPLSSAQGGKEGKGIIS